MDAVQLDLFAPAEEEPLHVICERKAEAICNELWAKYRENVREYVAECVDRLSRLAFTGTTYAEARRRSALASVSAVDTMLGATSAEMRKKAMKKVA